MPKGPKGEKRPADVISNAVRVIRILTGEAEEDFGPDDGKDKAAQAKRAARRDRIDGRSAVAAKQSGSAYYRRASRLLRGCRGRFRRRCGLCPACEALWRYAFASGPL